MRLDAILSVMQRKVAVGVVLLVALGCGRTSRDESEGPAGSGSSASFGGSAGVTPSGNTTWDGRETLMLMPDEQREPAALVVDGEYVYAAVNRVQGGRLAYATDIFAIPKTGGDVKTLVDGRTEVNLQMIEQGDDLFAIDTDETLVRIDKSSGDFEGLATGSIAVPAANDDALFVGPVTGLLRLNRATWDDAEVMTDDWVSALAADASFVYWTDSDHGLRRRDATLTNAVEEIEPLPRIDRDQLLRFHLPSANLYLAETNGLLEWGLDGAAMARYEVPGLGAAFAGSAATRVWSMVDEYARVTGVVYWPWPGERYFTELPQAGLVIAADDQYLYGMNREEVWRIALANLIPG